MRASRLRKATRPLTAAERKWLDDYTRKHPAPERVARALERELAEPKRPAALEVHTGPPTPSITAPPTAQQEDAPAPSPPPPSPAAPDAAPAPPSEPGEGLPGLAQPGEDKPKPAPAPITTEHPMAKAFATLYEVGADGWGVVLKQPKLAPLVKPYGPGWSVMAAEMWRERFGDGPMDRSKLVVAGAVVAAGGVVAPFFAPKPDEEPRPEPEERPAAQAPHAPPITQPIPTEGPEDDGPIAVAPLGARY